jgi:hypothetical protein
MGYRNLWILAGTFLPLAILCGCQSSNTGSGQGLRRDGPSPLASRANPPGASAWNNQAQPALTGNSLNAGGSRVTDPQYTATGLTDQSAASRPAAASPSATGMSSSGTRTTAFPQPPGGTAGSSWPQATPQLAPGSNSNSGTAPSPSWPPTTPTSRITVPGQDPMIPSAPTTSGSNYQTRYPAVPTMPPVRNGDE